MVGALAAFDAHAHPAGMFVVTEAEAAAIRAAFALRGEDRDRPPSASTPQLVLANARNSSNTGPFSMASSARMARAAGPPSITR